MDRLAREGGKQESQASQRRNAEIEQQAMAQTRRTARLTPIHTVLLLMLLTLTRAMQQKRTTGRAVRQLASGLAPRCVNDGESCRCSKQQDESNGVAMCARARGGTKRRQECTMEICDMPFRCDCRGQFMCRMRPGVQHWACESQSRRERQANTRGRCPCVKRTRASASYSLRVIGRYDAGRQPVAICDWDASFWA